MSLEGKTAADAVVRGKIHDLDVLVVSAYAIAVKNGFDGTEEEWLASLKGKDGVVGKDGAPGKDGATGKDGYTPVKGKDYWTAEDQAAIVNEAVEKMAGDGVSPDWNENDENKASHVRNRTHYKEYIGENRTLIPATEIPFSGKGANFEVSEGLVAGKAYKVTWNGKEYKTACYMETVDGLGDVCFLGNGTLFGAATESSEPFCIANYNTIYASVTKETEDSETITLQIDEVAEEIVHKLPGEFLPEGTPWIESGVGGLEEIPVVGMWGELDAGMYSFLLGEPIGLEVGKDYVVNWNGTDYSVTGTEIHFGEGLYGVSLGNMSIAEGADAADTGEPFVVAEFPAELGAEQGMFGVISGGDYSGYIPFAIYAVGATVHKMDEKLLPDGVMRAEGHDEVVLPETTMIVGYDTSDGKDIPSPIFLEEGRWYLVTWNGTPHRVQGEAYIFAGQIPCVKLANSVFWIISASNSGGLGLVKTFTSSEEVEATFSIQEDEVVYHNFPENVATKAYVDDAFEAGVVVRSSTEGSTKKFRITVDDSGTISAVEVTA